MTATMLVICWSSSRRYDHVWLQENLCKQNEADIWFLLANIMERFGSKMTQDRTVWLILWLFFSNELLCAVSIYAMMAKLVDTWSVLTKLTVDCKIPHEINCGWHDDSPPRIRWLRLHTSKESSRFFADLLRVNVIDLVGAMKRKQLIYCSPASCE